MAPASHSKRHPNRTDRHRELRIAIDTGGTFTDCVWVEDGVLKTLKVFSTPDDPSRAIAEALRKIGETSGREGSTKSRRSKARTANMTPTPTPMPTLTLLHGTTVGTNTLLQRKGARVALVTTAGFEDVIEMGRQARRKLYDFFSGRVDPLVPADLRFGVDERTAGDGEILQAPSEQALESLAHRLHEKHPEAI